MKPLQVSALAAGFGLVAVAAFYVGRLDRPQATTSAPSTAASAPTSAGRTVLYWHDPMAPGQRFDKPGKSPFMEMQLVPVYADSDPSSGVQVSSAVQQNLGIRYATVRRAAMRGRTATASSGFKSDARTSRWQSGCGRVSWSIRTRNICSAGGGS